MLSRNTYLNKESINNLISMATHTEDIIITLTPRKLLALGLLIVITVVTSSTYLSALFAFETEPTFPLDASTVILDSEMAPSSVFTPGDPVFVRAEIYKQSSGGGDYYYYEYYDVETAYRVMVLVTDEAYTPVYFNSTTNVISSGETQNTYFGFQLSNDALSGTYYVYVFPWSEWLPDGTALAEFAAAGEFGVVV